MAQRLIISAGWLAAAVLAVLVGLVAIRLIGDGITSPATEPMSQSEVQRALESMPPPAPVSPSTAPPSSAGPGTAAGTEDSRLTPGGTVVARCTDGLVQITSMSPAVGYSVHEWDDEPQDDSAEGEFRRQSDNQDRVKVEVLCGGSGEPQFSVRSEREDDD